MGVFPFKRPLGLRPTNTPPCLGFKQLGHCFFDVLTVEEDCLRHDEVVFRNSSRIEAHGDSDLVGWFLNLRVAKIKGVPKTAWDSESSSNGVWAIFISIITNLKVAAKTVRQRHEISCRPQTGFLDAVKGIGLGKMNNIEPTRSAEAAFLKEIGRPPDDNPMLPEDSAFTRIGLRPLEHHDLLQRRERGRWVVRMRHVT